MLERESTVMSSEPRWFERRYLRILVSIVMLGVLLYTVELDFARLAESFRRVLWWPIGLALLLRPLAIWTNAWHSALLLERTGCGLSLRDVWRASMFGEMLSRFVPGNIGTVAYVARLSRSAGDALAAQLLDRWLFLLSTLLLAAPSLALAGHVHLALAALVALAGAVLAGYLAYAGLVRWIPLNLAHRRAIDKMIGSSRDWGRAYALAALSSLALMAISFWLLMFACGGRASVFELVAAVTLVTIGAALPFSINGMGIREWVFVALLGDNFSSDEAALTLAGVTYLVGFASAFIGVLTWVVMRQKGSPVDA